MSARVGLALPSFVDDPEVPLEVARAAEEAGLDGVFVYDHLFRRARDGTRRPALDGVALLGAVAGATRRITVGTLVLRAWLRPAATAGAVVATAARLAPGRVIAAIGAGDSESGEENESFGLGFGAMSDRVARLDATVRQARARGARVWVGGRAAAVRDVAATNADGWNAWGMPVDRFGASADALRALAVHAGFECTWGGLVVVDGDDVSAGAKAERLQASSETIVGGTGRVAEALGEYVAAGADWVIVAPVDSQDPQNAELLAEVRARLASASPGD